MPVLIEILSKTTGKENRLLRGKTIECISLIGLSVGKKQFENDAKTLMELLLQSQGKRHDSGT